MILSEKEKKWRREERIWDDGIFLSSEGKLCKGWLHLHVFITSIACNLYELERGG